jgi:hypothetical protein
MISVKLLALGIIALCCLALFILAVMPPEGR